MPSSPAFDLGAEVREPFFTWTKMSSSSVANQLRAFTSKSPFKLPTATKTLSNARGTIMAAKSNSISRPLPSSIVFSRFSHKHQSQHQPAALFSQYLFKKQKRHMKLDVFIPKEKREQITEFVRCRPVPFYHFPYRNLNPLRRT
eukprot:UN20003